MIMIKAIIITGDGDFYCLVEYLREEGKLLHVMVPNNRFSNCYEDLLKISLESSLKAEARIFTN